MVVEEGQDWRLNHPESLGIYFTCEAFGWQIPPFEGGFTEWPDDYMQDLFKIHRRVSQVKEMRKKTGGPERRV